VAKPKILNLTTQSSRWKHRIKTSVC